MKKSLFATLILCVTLSIITGCSKPTLSDDSSSDTQDSNVITEYEKGTVTSTGFTSEYLNLSFAVPEAFVMATEEELDTMMETGAEVMEIDGKKIDYAKLTTVYEMMALTPSGSPNVIVLVEKLPLSNMTVEQYFDSLKEQLSGISTMEYQFDETTTSVEIAGQEYKKLTVQVEGNGASLLQDYSIRKNGDRMIGFITSYTEDTKDAMETLMGGFSEYQ